MSTVKHLNGMAKGESPPRPLIPMNRTLEQVRQDALSCKACDLWRSGTQTVFGATAAQALLGKTFRVTQHRGELLKSPLAPVVMATVHPSSILRAPDDETRHSEMQRFIEDLKRIAKYV